MALPIIHGCIATILACNYFSYQVELFQDEYEANQPMRSGMENGVSSPSVNWESFDKNHAQKPFIFKALVRIECIVLLRPIPIIPFFEDPPRQLVRDKSPPSLS